MGVPSISSGVIDQARRLPFTQLLFFAAVGVETVAVSAIDRSVISPLYVVAAAVVGLLAVAMLVLDRMTRLSPTRGTGLWLAVVPLIDLLACAVIRADAVEVLPAGGLLTIFPITWLAFAFPLPLLLVGIAGTVFVTAYPILREGQTISGAADWARVLTLPVVVTLFAVSAHAVGRDIAEKQRRLDAEAERARTASHSLAATTSAIETLAQTTPDAVAIFDLDGRPLMANEAARSIAVRAGRPGLTLTDGRADVYDERHGNPVEIGHVTIEHALAGEYTDATRVWVGPPGDQIALSVAARPVRGADGVVTGVALVGHDVTELVHAVEVRDSFLDTVGHELKTPLTAILGHADLLRGSADPHSAAAAETIERAGERLLGIVNQLIAAGRDTVTRGRAAPAPGLPAPVRQVIETVQAEGLVRGAAAGVEVEAVVEADVGLVRFDAHELAAVVRALVANAVQFTPPGGSVVIGARREADVVVLDVSDTGVGMTDEESGQAFDRFYRSPSAREQAVPGTGLGLSIVRSLAESNGASVSLASVPGHGTVVTLRMRVA